MAAFWLSAPLLVIGFGVGIVMNLVQVATSLQDYAFSTFPRLAAFLAGFIVLMPWMLKHLDELHRRVFSRHRQVWALIPMGTELRLDLGTLYAFLLVLARIFGAFIYVPLPGIQAPDRKSRARYSPSAMTFTLFAALADHRSPPASLSPC